MINVTGYVVGSIVPLCAASLRLSWGIRARLSAAVLRLLRGAAQERPPGE